MAQPKAPRAPKYNWLNEAWAVSKTLADIPSDPLSIIYAHPAFRRAARKIGTNALLEMSSPTPPKPAPKPALDPIKQASIELLQLKIMLYLTYRLDTVHEFRKRPLWWKDGQLPFESRRPSDTLKFAQWLGTVELKLSPPEFHAINAHMMLGRILKDGYVSDAWKRQLPLSIASISGPSSSEVAILRATQPRPRRIALRDAKREFKATHRDADCWNLLDVLKDEGFIDEWTPEIIYWTDYADGGEGKAKTTATSTFRNWK